MKHELTKVLYAAYDIQGFKPCKAFHRESTQKNISIDLSFPPFKFLWQLIWNTGAKLGLL